MSRKLSVFLSGVSLIGLAVFQVPFSCLNKFSPSRESILLKFDGHPRSCMVALKIPHLMR